MNTEQEINTLKLCFYALQTALKEINQRMIYHETLAKRYKEKINSLEKKVQLLESVVGRGRE